MDARTQQIKFNLIDLFKNLTLLIIIALPFLGVYFLTSLLPEPLDNLFKYSLLSLSRIAAAYFLSLIFAVSAGFAAAFNKKFEKILLPTIDILQSVPVVGFFPIAIALFVSLFQGERLGVEMASIFLIFTSQAWNLALGVYESLITIPKDLLRLSNSLGLKGWIAFKKLYFPACIPSLTYNSMVSWANSWFFLMSSEVFAIGVKEFKLPGIGYLLWLSSERGNVTMTLIILGNLLLIIYLLHKLFFEPLSLWAKKFTYQMVPEGETTQPSIVLSKIKDLFIFFRLNAFFGLLKTATQKIEKSFLRNSSRLLRLAKPLRRPFLAILSVTFLILFFTFLYSKSSFFASLLTQHFPFDFLSLSILAVFISFLRIALVYLVCLAISYPLAIFLALNENAYRKITPLLQMAASIPGTAIYPLALSLVLANKIPFGLEIAASLVILSTSFWYVFFPVLGLMKSIPREIRESVASLSSSRWFIAKKVLIPGSFPALVTGSLAAWGGSWNALVVAEYGVFDGRVYDVFGIGALLNIANYQDGDPLKIGITLMVLVSTIIVLNKLVWQNLYRLAAKRFSLEIE